MDFYLTFDPTLHSAGVQESRCLFSIDMPLRWSGESRPGEDLYGISIALAIHSLDQSLFIPLISYEVNRRLCALQAIDMAQDLLSHSLFTRLIRWSAKTGIVRFHRIFYRAPYSVA